MRATSLTLLSLLAAAATPAAEDSPEPPRLRLPTTVAAEGNRVRLVLDPEKPTFNGRIEIDVRIAEPTRVVWLNSQDLTVRTAAVKVAGETRPLEPRPQKEDFLGLRAESDLPPGPATLVVEYDGKVEPTSTEGLFHQKEGDDWYLFTQFEPYAARRAFPCFDEPSSKTPWQITLDVPARLRALSNTPVASEKTAGDRKVVTFTKTRPLPSYLVAFAVGPFDTVDAGKSRSGAPTRIVVPRGRGRDARWAAASTGPLLALLEDYFGMPYPYEKLDILTVPATAGFGAMENPGLVTYQQGLVLAKPEEESIRFRRSYASITAHELAHQWFGNYVTLAWWDDLWLNEAFASWMGDKVTDRWKPEWDGAVGFVTRRSNAMGSDSLMNARRIRQPVSSKNDIRNAFDGITYGKGAAVLTMFERWVGEETFRKGVRSYLAKHAWRNATAGDFLAAVGEAAGRDVATPFGTFLDQPGAPLVSFSLSCEVGRPPRLALEQKRYLPRGSRASPNQTWQLPICVAYDGGGQVGRECTLLTEPKGELELPRASACPTWILPNQGQLGYYRSKLEGPLLEALVDQGLDRSSLPERVGAIGDLNALVAAGQADPGLVLGLVARLAKDPSRHIASAAAGIAQGPTEIVPDDHRPHYARFVRRMFGEQARALGWTPRPEEDDDTRLLRSTLLGLVTDQGEDRELAAAARPLALAWLGDHRAVDPDLVRLVLVTAARYGDAELFDRLHREARKATDRADRALLLGALGSFRDPELARRGLGLLLAGEFDVRESFGLLFGPLQQPHTRGLVYDWVKENWDALLARIPREISAGLAFVATAQCDAAKKPDLEAFFKDRVAALPGGPLVYAQAMEQHDLCVAYRESHRPAVVEFLKAY
jgi:alanyl aminopeptidase